MSRAGGISVPLFAIPTSRSWGIGEFDDLVAFARWASAAGQSVVQILPVMELPAFKDDHGWTGQSSSRPPNHARRDAAVSAASPLGADGTTSGGVDEIDTTTRTTSIGVASFEVPSPTRRS